jgi:predicted nucleic-acid-binding Zn-ribbon protein
MSLEEESDNKCPKCLTGEVVEHPSLLSMPLTSRIAVGEKKAIEDQDADFVFRFSSCRNCGYSEFYLIDSGSDSVAKKQRI